MPCIFRFFRCLKNSVLQKDKNKPFRACENGTLRDDFAAYGKTLTTKTRCRGMCRKEERGRLLR